MRHLFRRNGRYQFRYKLPKSLSTALAVAEHRELRLSLFTTHHVHAQELASAYYLACREIISTGVARLGIGSIDDLKEHVRIAALSHAPQQHTSLIELAGSADQDRLIAAIKVLQAYNTDFFVLVPPSVPGTIRKLTDGHYLPIAKVDGQTLPHMRIPAPAIHHALKNGLDSVDVLELFYSVTDEQFCFTPADGYAVFKNHQGQTSYRPVSGYSVSLHQLFVKADLSPEIITSIRRLAETTRPAVQATVEVPASPLLSKEIETYCAFKKKAWTEKTANEFAMHLAVFLEMVTDKPVLTINNTDYDYFTLNLPKLPVRRTQDKRYRGLSIREVLALNPTDVISSKTVEQYFGTVSTFISWLGPPRNEGLKTGLLKMRPHTNERKKEKRKPFTQEHLSTMFELQKSLDFLSEAKHPYQVWLPVIGLHTGARLDELCALRLEDFQVERGYNTIHMNDEEDAKRQGKTPNAPRVIPMHKTLIDLGLLKYVEWMRSRPTNQTDGRLFPECTYVEGHSYRKSASRWFNAVFLEYLGISDPLYVFHSFRWNVSDVTNDNPNLQTWRTSTYLGHALNKDEAESVRSYKTITVENLLPVLDSIIYPIDWTGYKELTATTYK